MSAIITLTTDFGTADPWVGIMKGVILSINPAATIVDITHEIPPQDVAAAARALRTFGDTFPPGAVHLVVVDPGVGSNREAVIVRTGRYFYVGPNNGVFTCLDSPPVKTVKIHNPEFLLKKISVTFHGRDIFAPAAAHLGSRDMGEFGPEIAGPIRLALPEPSAAENALTGEITHFDRFGNAFTNIPEEMVLGLGAQSAARDLEVAVNDTVIPCVSYYYQSAPPGRLGAIINGFDLLELFTPNADARRLFGLKPGDRVTVRPSRGK